MAYFVHYPIFVIKNREIANFFFTKRVGVGVNIYDTTQPVNYSFGFPANYKKQHYSDEHPHRILANDLEIVSFKACDTVFVRNIKTQEEHTKALRSIKAREFVEIDFDSSFDRFI